MNLRITNYDGTTTFLTNCIDFEFRTNHVSNWVWVKYEDGSVETIHNIAAIKTIKEELL